ncbi:MAG TPA: nuclear transport factor 2 family protein [Frankiaceae bacterium]|jgi:ketosteroid isomerase-like protein|nr:nuclear transport factor 2 family protein [Frankiaceae bacterium]
MDVEALLRRLGEAVGSRDHEATLALFAPDASVVFVGSEAGEQAFGWAELRAWLDHVYARPIAFRWEWSRIETSSRGDVVWFLADGDVVETVGASESRTAYRMSGVAYGSPPLLALVHGSEPVAPK